jgi:hypothetical protein
MNDFTKKLIKRLEADDWREPTKKKFLTYAEASKRLPRDSNVPHLEDLHYAWRNHKPNNLNTAS